MSVASLREELEREQALYALAGHKAPQGGSSDLIHWEIPLRSYPTERIARHLRPGDPMRVTLSLMPQWVTQMFGDASQVDGHVRYKMSDPWAVRLQATGLQHNPEFTVRVTLFIQAVLHGQVIDAT